MRRRLIRETGIFVALLMALALLMHPDLLSAPGERLTLMGERENYLHPLFYTTIVYGVLALLRALFAALSRVIKRASSDH